MNRNQAAGDDDALLLPFVLIVCDLLHEQCAVNHGATAQRWAFGGAARVERHFRQGCDWAGVIAAPELAQNSHGSGRGRENQLASPPDAGSHGRAAVELLGLRSRCRSFADEGDELPQDG